MSVVEVKTISIHVYYQDYFIFSSDRAKPGVEYVEIFELSNLNMNLKKLKYNNTY